MGYSRRGILPIVLALLAWTASGCANLAATLEAIPRSTPGAAAALLPTLTPEAGGEPGRVAPPSPDGPPEVEVLPITLAGPAAQRNAQFSGMAWYGETLILLPQYPDFAADGTNALYALPRSEVLAWIDRAAQGEKPPALLPSPVTFLAPGLADSIPGYEGYEAIAFDGERFYVTLEAQANGQTGAYLFVGRVDSDNNTLSADTSVWQYIAGQSGLSNNSDESILVTPDGPMTLHEINGVEWSAAPLAHRFDAALQPLGAISFPNIEYRITDATPLDGDGRFWAINYFFPGDEWLTPASDPIADLFGRGPTHSTSVQVERLLEFRFDGAQIVRTERAPVQLQLTLLSRNWEGIVRLEERGFLLITDQFPETTLGFVSWP